jgi:hypothetical protein
VSFRERKLYFSGLLCSLILSGTQLFGTWQKTADFSSSTGQTLRGFGKCELRSMTYQDGDKKVAVMRFTTTSEEKARIIAGKFIGELKQSHGVREETIRLNGVPNPILVSNGGQAFLVSCAGTQASIVGAGRQEILEGFFTANPLKLAGSMADGDYPEYMKRFGWSTHGVGGFENYHGWMKRTQKDPIEDFAFLKQMGIHYDNWLDIAGFDSSDGLMRNNGMRWKIKYARDHKIPFAYRIFINSGGANWTARRFAEYMEEPAAFLQRGWLRPSLMRKAEPHFSWYSKDIQGYLAKQTKDIMEKFQTPETRGWMQPHGELFHDMWYDMHSDYSIHARQNWHEYLQKHGVTLAEAARMFGRGNDAFQVFEQVPIPEFATFAGLPGRIQSLAGQWFYRKDLEKAPKDEDWWNLPAVDRYPGLKNQYYVSDLALDGWGMLKNMPGDEGIYSVLNPQIHTSSCWFRRSFNYLPGQARGNEVYLYFFPASKGKIHSGEHKRYHQVYINGEKAGEIGTWGALKATKLLKSGLNQIAIQLHGGLWDGRIFLSTDEPKVFPYLGQDRNRLWQLWNNWRIDAKYDAWSTILEAMRQADPDKPIKFMAPKGFGTPKAHKLAINYGGFPHFTGEGVWFFPWYKRYGKLYGIPASSESGAPCKTLDRQIDDVRRVFLAGLDAHQPVFITQTYSRNPELRKWWLERKQLLERVGKHDIYGPQVLLYLASANTLSSPLLPYPEVGQASRPIQNPRNWDLGRGTLQTIGQSYLYLDDDGIADRKMNGYPLIIDCGNENFNADNIPALKKYVENGGVFVALGFTGRNTMTSPDSWPIRELTGCQASIRPLGGKITFAKDQPFFRQHAGKTYPDNGKSIDYIGNNHNRYSVELSPEEGVEHLVPARYENGKAAIVVRKLGKGMVVTLGSQFWRRAEDRRGLWWPEIGETDFIADLLEGVGFPAPLGESSDRLIWPQPYRSNNGLDAVTVLVNWNKTGTQHPQITLRLPEKPAKIVSYSVDGIQNLPFKWENGLALLTIDMPAREVKVIAAEVYSPESAVTYWWKHQQELWHELIHSTKDFTKYTVGKWAPTAQSLSENARFTNEQPADDWTTATYDDSKWHPSPLDMFTFWGAKENGPIWVRKHFDVDPAWLRSGLVRLISGAWDGPHYQTPTRMILNGRELHDFTKRSFNEFDVTKLLKVRDNILAFEIKAAGQYAGIIGDVYLKHRAAPKESFDLSKGWLGTDAKGGPMALAVPGKTTLIQPQRQIFIPKDWEGKYKIRFFETGDPKSIVGVWVNGVLVRRHHHHLGRYCDLDITRHLKYGAENRLELACTGDLHMRLEDKQPYRFEIDSVHLDLFPIK